VIVNLQLEVRKWEQLNTEVAFSHAMKAEAYEQSLVSQGTLVADHVEGRLVMCML